MKRICLIILMLSAFALCSFTDGKFSDTDVSEIKEAVSSSEMLQKEGVLRSGIDNAVIANVYFAQPDSLTSVNALADIDTLPKTVCVFTENETVTLQKTGDKWEVIGFGTHTEEGKQYVKDQYSLLRAACESGKDIRIVELSECGNMLCIVNDNNGSLTLTPVSGREDFTSLGIGNEYALTEAASTLSKEFPTVAADQLPDEKNGGAAASYPSSESDKTVVIVCAVVFASALVLAAYFFAVKKKKTQAS